jgi:ATP-dependent Clp protease adaptor protein ClpS
MPTAPVKKRKVEEDTALAPLWKVLFHNDDRTTMEFVMKVLMEIFEHNQSKAFEIMMQIHETGIGLVGIYSQEDAKLKQEQTISLARAQKFPLKVTIEQVEYGDCPRPKAEGLYPFSG